MNSRMQNQAKLVRLSVHMHEPNSVTKQHVLELSTMDIRRLHTCRCIDENHMWILGGRGQASVLRTFSDATADNEVTSYTFSRRAPPPVMARQFRLSAVGMVWGWIYL